MSELSQLAERLADEGKSTEEIVDAICQLFAESLFESTRSLVVKAQQLDKISARVMEWQSGTAMGYSGSLAAVTALNDVVAILNGTK